CSIISDQFTNCEIPGVLAPLSKRQPCHNWSLQRRPIVMHLSRLLLVPGLALALVVQAEAAPIDLPIKTWVKRRLPLAGQGPCPYGCKHMRLAVNPVNGRIYFEGGDYSTIDF